MESLREIIEELKN